VGCMGRRSPGRSGRGGPPPGVIGRGRWKIGCPGTGRPGAGRIVPAGEPVGAIEATGAIGRGGGALYTGRGPVCGTIMRGAGGCGGPATTGGRGAATGAWGAADAEIVGAADDAGGPTTAAGGGVGRGATSGAGVEAETVGAVGVTIAGFSATGATTAGRAGGINGVAGGVEIEGVGGGGVGRATGGATVGLATTAGGAAGRTGAGAAASFFCVIALSTSPGREMFDKSILVLISSSPRSGRADRADGACASDDPRRWIRTFSASCSSSELEWVFFSVTPTMASVSRMALLLTSSSLARSLIRTLLIRPFLYSAFVLGLHRSLTELQSCTGMPSQMSAHASIGIT
jgi:hypothetical protein